MYLTQSLHNAVQRDPDRISTIFGSRTRAASETIGRVACLAGALRRLGVRSGDRVGILALNSDRYHEVLYAVPWAGGAVNPANVRWSAREVAYSLDDCGTEVLFVDDAFAAMVPNLTAGANGLRTVIFCGEGATPEGMLDYEELVRVNQPVEDACRCDDDLYGVFYTGGTTGHPKGVMLSHRACLASAMGSLVTTDLISRGGILLHAAPMFHLADIAIWTIGNLTGSVHVIVPSFSPGRVVEAIAAHGVTDVLLVPTMIQMLMDSAEIVGADLSSVRHLVYGASPISETVLAKARAVLPRAAFTQAYGMTELAPVATVLAEGDHHDPSLVRSCGRPAVQSELRIVDADDNELPRHQVGEIVVRGDHMMLGYWNKPAETESALRNDWMHTGDAGYMDERGYVFVVDRIKDMIVTGGENVYSVEVENALAKHPAVVQVAVIGVPDSQWGERVHAVVTTPEGRTLTLEEIQDFCREQIATYKVPRSMEVVTALPVSAAGKILKREVREQYWGASSRAVN